MKQVVLITGTSTGLGLETSLNYGRNGYKVYATMRNLNKKEKLMKKIKEENLDIEIKRLDVTDKESIKKCVLEIIEKEKKIDILINNAGAGFISNIEELTEKDMNWVTDVNYHGVVRTIQEVIPFMRKARSGHIINVSSVGGLVGQPFNEVYCGAKFAVEGFTEALASYTTREFGIKFTLIEPGAITSEFANNALKKLASTPLDQDSEYAPIFKKYVDRVTKRFLDPDINTSQTSQEVASIVYDVSQMEKPPLRIRTSEWAEEFSQIKTKTDKDGLILLNDVIDNFL